MLLKPSAPSSGYSFTLKMETAGYSETEVTLYQTTQHHITGYSNVRASIHFVLILC
jgi:hypothetical protein